MSIYLEVPICIENKDGETKDVTARLRPAEIAFYYPGFHWGCVIVMKSGASFLSSLSDSEIDSALQQFDGIAKKAGGKISGNITLKKKD